MNRSILGVLALAASAAVVQAHAGATLPPAGTDPTITRTGRHDNRFYAGINWNFGVRDGATVVVGYRGAKVSSGGHVDGFKAEIGYVLSGAPSGLAEARLKYLNGSRSAQGEAGVGFSFASQAPLVNLGVQGPYANGNYDYLFGKGSLGSIGVNTLGRARKPTETATCPAGSSLVSGLCEIAD
ncbi:MAG: hypothetical protein ABI520_16465 [Caldimonas sp.]